MLTTLGLAAWNAVLRAGYALGANRDRVSGWVDAYSDVLLAAVAIVAATYLTVRGLRCCKRRTGR